MQKIMIDCGHYKNYNQSNVFKKYYEGNMTWQLGQYLKEELEKYDVRVDLTRNKIEQDLNVYDRGLKSKGYDLFLSLHSNYVDNEKVDRVVIIKTLNNKNDDFAAELCRVISETMGIKSKYQITTREYKGNEYYGVLRGCRKVGVEGYIIEHSFHSNLQTAKWLFDNNNLKKLAYEESKVIAKKLNLKKKEQYPFLVRVQCDTLNIRSLPSVNSDIKGQLKKGDVYTILEVKNGWGKLKYELGWINISNKYVSKM